MSSEADRQAWNQVAPVQSDTPGEGVTILAATTTAANTAIPSKLHNRYVFFEANGDDIWVTFGATNATALDKSAAGAATFALGTGKSRGVIIKDGQRVAWRLNATDHKYIHWQANAANSKLTIYPLSPKCRGA